MTPEHSDHLEMFVLDVMRHDSIEQVANILKMINDTGCIGWRHCWPGEFTRAEIQTAINGLWKGGLVDAFEESHGGAMPKVPHGSPDTSISDLWFSITKAGWKAWDEWTPPKTYDPDSSDQA